MRDRVAAFLVIVVYGWLAYASPATTRLAEWFWLLLWGLATYIIVSALLSERYQGRDD